MSEKQIGLVGLGAMGMGMARSLRRAGYRVHVFDVRREVADGFASDARSSGASDSVARYSSMASLKSAAVA